jgi:hypothetical protein
MTRQDQTHFDWLLGGFFKDLGSGFYEVTDRGRESADLGFYETDPPAGR